MVADEPEEKGHADVDAMMRGSKGLLPALRYAHVRCGTLLQNTHCPLCCRTVDLREVRSVDPTPLHLVTDGVDFGEALRSVRAGSHIMRDGWRGSMYVFLLEGDELRLAYFVAVDRETGFQQPWSPSQIDLLADDWRIIS